MPTYRLPLICTTPLSRFRPLQPPLWYLWTATTQPTSPRVHTTSSDVSQHPQGSPIIHSTIVHHQPVALREERLSHRTTEYLHNYITIMSSRFVENLDAFPPISHPHLNVSLEDILAEESRKRMSSQSIESTQNSSQRSASNPSTTSISSTNLSKLSTIKRSLTHRTKKNLRTS